MLCRCTATRQTTSPLTKASSNPTNPIQALRFVTWLVAMANYAAASVNTCAGTSSDVKMADGQILAWITEQDLVHMLCERLVERANSVFKLCALLATLPDNSGWYRMLLPFSGFACL